MNIDERIEALTERTEALTHNVGLLSQMHQDNEKTYARLFNQLARIPAAHEVRISDLEDGGEKS
jgi:hypothetical protein